MTVGSYVTRNFSPIESTAKITIDATGEQVAFITAAGINAPDVMITNNGTNPFYFASGVAQADATAILPIAGSNKSTPILPGQSVLAKNGAWVGGICDTGLSVSVIFTAGIGG